MNARPRILVITRNLPPLVGGMERLNWHMLEQLGKYFEVQVIGPCGAKDKKPADTSVQEAPLRPLWRFLLVAQWHALVQVLQLRPDVVLAGSGLTAPIAWVAAKITGAKSVVYVHGLDLAVSHPLYRALWLPTIRRMNWVIANSHPTAKLAANAGVASSRLAVIHPGVSLPENSINDQQGRRIRDETGLCERPIILSVGRFTRRKGLREFVGNVLPKIVAHKPDVVLVVVGDIASDALNAESQTRDAILATARAAGVHSNIHFLGVITDRDRLAAVYRAANLHVFPVRELPNDPEGFGMVAVEAAAHGVATVAYATGGVIDAVAENESGRLVPPGADNDFASAVLESLDRPLDPALIYRHAAKFTWDAFGVSLTSLLLSELDS